MNLKHFFLLLIAVLTTAQLDAQRKKDKGGDSDEYWLTSDKSADWTSAALALP